MLWLYLEKRRISKPGNVDDGDDEISELKVKGINCQKYNLKNIICLKEKDLPK